MTCYFNGGKILHALDPVEQPLWADTIPSNVKLSTGLQFDPKAKSWLSTQN